MDLSKIKNPVLLISFIFMVVCCKAPQNVQHELGTAVVKPKYPEITKIISTVYDNVYKFIDRDKAVVVIYTYKLKDTYIVQATIFYKNNFGWFLRDSHAEPYGVFEYQNTQVVVLGKFSDMIFIKTKEKKTFEWLKALPPLETNIVYIPPNFDPPAWRYEFSNSNFDFKGTGFLEYEK